MKPWHFILLLSLFLHGCEDVNYRSSVPHVPVDYTLYITQEYPHFKPAHGYQAITITSTKYEREAIGYAGLLIWVGMDEAYHAADLCCPHCLNRKQPVKLDGIYAVCPTCDEHFDLSYGFAFPTKGKTKEPLRKYQIKERSTAAGLALQIIN